jgi:flagellar protein FlbB
VLGRILGLLLLIVLLSAVGLLWLDILGLVDVRTMALPVLKMVGLTTNERTINAEDPLLLDRERLIKREQSLTLLQEELGLATVDLKKQNDDVLQKQNALAEQQKALEDQQNSFNEAVKAADDKKANLVQNSKYLTNMPPKTAVEILLKMEDQDLIDLFRVTEELAKANGTASIVSAWLAKFPPERAAAIQRKMARKSGS